MRLEHHDFRSADLVGGDPALDLVNTVTARDTQPRDWLDDYFALLRWARQTECFARADLATLETQAQAAPAKAAAALARCKALREALCDALYALAHGRAPTPPDLDTIDQARLAASKAARLVSRDSRLQTHWSAERSGLDLIAHVITAYAIELLKDARVDRLRVCDGNDCGWVFIDTSKSGRRRWCDMATCGNVAKARRFQQRQRE
ncbi:MULTISPECIES: CGNR zinc finger domain-containing protein [unclassified Lysobacter]|uniref:CGNR zinc finger domain-containing protein n=1 Tax=unclassified Lysobacter TaxID=2635362 RepID=UPI001BECBA59|nr:MULTISPECIES: CGNR zinc finger domain-containing protein [unclassified Lysobacter]MBT2748193.1 CGNR zinc finger domain-containing protein [Lysobacter sp. ISL-42]MBT2753873.1 CGNR zinc finger domain-containing protein [Lysobacter sp. ISL-50]MBT2778969.1 CGNR zinc finger domain-containing protein [Lysobacter sp. ISL-54]MBT2783820.1 CGNR zinc finger domain-containing protein [Lysobacter sp. ISL-52]